MHLFPSLSHYVQDAYKNQTQLGLIQECIKTLEHQLMVLPTQRDTIQYVHLIHMATHISCLSKGMLR